MIIDDNEIDLFIGKKVVELYGFANDVINKNNCKDALNYLSKECNSKQELPDFIFCDWFMPIQNGQNFLEEFAKKPEKIINQCKVIILSTLIDEKEIQELIKKKHVYAFLQKPLSENSLKAIIKKGCSQ